MAQGEKYSEKCEKVIKLIFWNSKFNNQFLRPYIDGDMSNLPN